MHIRLHYIATSYNIGCHSAIAIVLDISVFSKRKFNVNLDAIFDSIVSWVDIHNVINFII